MLTPEEIANSEVPDKLFMISYISQFYTSLRDKKPYGGQSSTDYTNFCLPFYLV